MSDTFEIQTRWDGLEECQINITVGIYWIVLIYTHLMKNIN